MRGQPPQVRPHRVDIATADRTGERRGEAEVLDIVDGATQQRQRGARGLVLRDAGLDEQPRRDRHDGDDVVGREDRGRMVERAQRRRHDERVAAEHADQTPAGGDRGSGQTVRDLGQDAVRHGEDHDGRIRFERADARAVARDRVARVDQRVRRRFERTAVEDETLHSAALRERRAERDSHAPGPDNGDAVAQGESNTRMPARRRSRPSAGRGRRAITSIAESCCSRRNTSPSR